MSNVYTFQMKFGLHHQKVTITIDSKDLTMEILRQVARRFVETMVSLALLPFPSIFCFQCPNHALPSLEHRLLLYRYEPLSTEKLIPLEVKDLLHSKVIIEIILSRKSSKKKFN